MLNCFVLAIKKDSFLILKNLFLPGGIFSHHITVFLNKTQKGVLTKLKEQNLKFSKKKILNSCFYFHHNKIQCFRVTELTQCANFKGGRGKLLHKIY